MEPILHLVSALSLAGFLIRFIGFVVRMALVDGVTLGWAHIER